MQRHDLDPWSLVFGVAFLTVSGSYLLTHTTDMHLHWLVALPAVLIVVGVGILAASVKRMQGPASEIDVDNDRGVV